jgi:hypothetical protein
VQERHVARLCAFVYRARRVLATSVVDAYFREARANNMVIRYIQESNHTTVVRRLPDEEALEALAGRVRPLTLSGDPTWYGHALTALGALSNQDPELVQRARDLRRAWQHACGSATRGYWVQRIAPTGSDVTTDRQLAWAWLYGDLVHADPHTAAIDDLGLEERVLAAVGLMDELVLLTTATLALIEEAQDSGLLDLPNAPFESPVVLGRTEAEGRAWVVVAPEGTPAPLDLTPLSSGVVPEGWTFIENVPELGIGTPTVRSE